MNDTERLNALQNMMKGYGKGWICRMSSQGKGILLHESSREGSVPDIREAIDNFVVLNNFLSEDDRHE